MQIPMIGRKSSELQEPLPEYQTPDLSQLTDRELLEQMFIRADRTEFLVRSAMERASQSPMLGSLIGRLV